MIDKYRVKIFCERKEVGGLREYLRRNGCTKCILGISKERGYYLEFVIPGFKKGPLAQKLKKQRDDFEISKIFCSRSIEQKNILDFVGTSA